MALTNTAPFAQKPQHTTAIAITAVPLTGVGSYADDAPANTVLAETAGADGAIVTSISAIPRATCTASQLMLWSSSDLGVTKRLIASALAPAYTLAATTQNVPTVFKHPDNATTINETNPLRLAAAERLYVGTAVTLAAGFAFSVRAVDF